MFRLCTVLAIEREHSGIRRICGYGVTITRGAASAMMFTYASLLVTMCRNIITFLRDTFLHIYVPFDDAVSMHKYIAFLAAVFTRQYSTCWSLGLIMRPTTTRPRCAMHSVCLSICLSRNQRLKVHDSAPIFRPIFIKYGIHTVSQKTSHL